ncbi:hypothetical protein [Kordia sp.]|uniref:hypothetical protein n=1 Tax=Kordia sp. TaxID=1965332 RepID=UPI003B5B0804
MLNTEKTFYVKNADQLAFCRVCQNKSFDVKKGTICGLTNELATFQKECDTFSLNDEELEKTESKIRQQIYDHVHQYNADPITIDRLNKQLKWLFYPVKNPTYKTAKNTHALTFKDENRKDGDVGFSFGAIVFIILLFILLENGWYILINILALFAAIGYFIYSLLSYFNYTHKGPLKTTEEGLYYREKIYYWGDINDFCYYDFSSSNYKNRKLILGSISNGMIEVNLNDVQINESQIIEILNLNILNHYEKLGKKRGEIIVSGE